MTAAASRLPAVKPSPLGRGLSALLGDAQAAVAVGSGSAAPGPGGASGNGPRKIPLAWIQPGIYQPRRRFDEAAIDDLATSIRERGVIQPLIVRPVSGHAELYEIIAGERRWRASQRAGLHELPVIVLELSDREALEIALIENIQRQDLSPLEEAEGYQRLLREFHHTQEALALIVGKSRPHVTNMLRLLNLPEPIKAMLDDKRLTMGHARAIATVPNPVALAEDIVRKGLNVRQAEELAQHAAERAEAASHRPKRHPRVDADTAALKRDLLDRLGLQVRFSGTIPSGKVVITYHTLDQMDDLIRRLKA